MDSLDKRRVRKKEAKAARPKAISDKLWERAKEEALQMAKEDEWSKGRPLHFAALFAILFEKVYDFEPLDMTPPVRLAACGMAAGMLKSVFDGSTEKLATYLQWVWQREAELEAWRKKNDKGGRTLGWRLVFGRALLNEFANATRRGR